MQPPLRSSPAGSVQPSPISIAGGRRQTREAALCTGAAGQLLMRLETMQVRAVADSVATIARSGLVPFEPLSWRVNYLFSESSWPRQRARMQTMVWQAFPENRRFDSVGSSVIFARI